NDVVRTGNGDPAQDHLAHLDLGRDNDVDRKMIPGKEIHIMWLEVELRAYARDLGRHFKQRMRNLTGNHVDLVVERYRDDHVRLVGARFRQHAGIGAMSDYATDIQRVSHRTNEARLGVDDADVMAFGSQPFRDAVAHLAGTANDHLHASAPR